MYILILVFGPTPSKPLRLRGLKFLPHLTRQNGQWSKPLRLRGLKSPGIIYPTRRQLSKPLRLRGLKFIIHGFYNITPGVEAYAASWIEIQQTMEKYKKVLSRSLCGFVDWNIYHTGSVIIVICRGLCGFVDWNKHDQGIGGQAVFVESDATSWIELD